MAPKMRSLYIKAQESCIYKTLLSFVALISESIGAQLCRVLTSVQYVAHIHEVVLQMVLLWLKRSVTHANILFVAVLSERIGA